MMRHGLSSLLSRHARFQVGGETDSSPKALDLVHQLSPDLALVDITLKSANGIELTKVIRVLSPSTQVLVVSMHAENLYAERALRAGAMGYLMKHEAAETLVIAIDHILRGEVFVSERMKDRMLYRFVHQGAATFTPLIDRLSDREMEVLRLIGEGYGTRDIARRLILSVKTIDSYKEHLKLKLELAGGSDLARYAIQWMKTENL